MLEVVCYFFFGCVFVLLTFYFYFLQLYCPSGISPMRNLGCRPREKLAATVALPSLRCVLGVLVFPQSTKLWHGLWDLQHARRCKCNRTRGMYRHHKRVFTESWLGEKSLAALRNRTCMGWGGGGGALFLYKSEKSCSFVVSVALYAGYTFYLEYLFWMSFKLCKQRVVISSGFSVLFFFFLYDRGFGGIQKRRMGSWGWMFRFSHITLMITCTLSFPRWQVARSHKQHPQPAAAAPCGQPHSGAGRLGPLY